jgi:hypothetical protein
MDEFADVVASLTENPTAAERQAVLDATDMRARLRAAMACVKKDLDNLEIMTMVKNEMERAIGERNKEHIIGEQMKALKKISGKKDDREVQLEKFRKNLEGSKMPKDVEEVFESEAAKFLQMDGREAEVGFVQASLPFSFPESSLSANLSFFLPLPPHLFFFFLFQSPSKLPRLALLYSLGPLYRRLLRPRLCVPHPQRGPLRPRRPQEADRGVHRRRQDQGHHRRENPLSLWPAGCREDVDCEEHREGAG